MQVFQDKNIITAEQLRQAVQDLDGRGEKKLGPKLVAKAWTDTAFKAKLLRNAGDAAEELGIQSSNFAPKPKAAGAYHISQLSPHVLLICPTSSLLSLCPTWPHGCVHSDSQTILACMTFAPDCCWLTLQRSKLKFPIALFSTCAAC